MFGCRHPTGEASKGNSGLLLLHCIFAATLLGTAHSQKGYLISAPAIFRSGVNQSISVRIYRHHSPVETVATVIDWRSKEVLTSATAIITDGGVITLRVPRGVKGKAILQVCGNCHLDSGIGFRNSTTITIVNKGTSAFVRTDKPIYKPRQRVFINIYTVDRELRPVSENISAYARAPNGVKIVQWKNIQPACCGTTSISFPLSDQPPLGEWKIFAELQGNVYNTTFEVAEYVLPKFDVSIKPPPLFRDFSVCEEAVVTAHYAFGEPVTGNLLVNTSVTGIGYYYTKDFDRGSTTIRNMTFNGEARFAICLQDNLGRRLLNRHFRGTLSIWATVTTEDGSKFTAFDDTTVISRDLVEVEFTSDTRKHFKEGVPFQGKILAKYLNGTGAGNIAVKLRVEDDVGEFMSQELMSQPDGMIPFTIPVTAKSTKFLWLDARVIAVGNVNTGHQYLSVYQYLHSWHSPSNCHLSVGSPSHDLTIGKLTALQIKSTCRCEFNLQYELVSRGDILQSGSVEINESNSYILLTKRKRDVVDADFSSEDFSDGTAGAHLCQINFPIKPSASMAPLSKLLVYYVRPDGEGIADSINLQINPKLENEVVVKSVTQPTSPGQQVNLTVHASKSSCLCLGITDKSLHIMRPNHLLTSEEIFDEVLSYDMDNLPFEEEKMWYSPSRRQRRSLNNQHQISSRDSFHAFLETGLVIMTNFVTLDHKKSIQVYSEFRRQALVQAQVVRAKLRKRKRVRAFFPETWYWKCFNTSSSGTSSISLEVPDTITTWLVSAVATSTQSGIGVSNVMEIKSSKKFFVGFNLPYSAMRNEEILIPLTVYNYIDECVEVRLGVALPPTASFTDQPTQRKHVRYLCMSPHSSRVMTFNLTFKQLGVTKILAVADAVKGLKKCCSKESRLFTSYVPANQSHSHESAFPGDIIATDALIKTILIEAEGEPREYTHSVFFCPNERMNITTPPGTFHFVKFSKGRHGLNFFTKADSTVHIALGKTQAISDTSYEIVLGGQGNTRTWIQKNGEILKSRSTNSILSPLEFRSFWVEWTESNLTIGYGLEKDKVSEILHILLPSSVNATYVGLATNGQSPAEFRLWSKDDRSEGFSEVFQLDAPKNAVPGSITGVTSVIGDVMGPTLKNLNNLLKLPYGCGEQNLINFAPNIYILRYLKLTNQLSSSTETQATEYLVQGYQRQLTYRRKNGSYSTFGNADKYGSMWLTAFVMKSYSAAKKFIYVDENEIQQALDWILSHQREDGSFPARGKILNKDVQGGIDRKIALTAYVVVALLETGAVSTKYEEALSKAIDYLEGMLYDYQDPYTAALTAYALTLRKSRFAEEARMTLLDMSLTSNSGSYRYWSLKSHVEPQILDASDIFSLFGDSTRQTVASAEIELASYALLAFTASRDVSIALPIVRWISQRRNSQGGFSSTQDTCVALQALSEYAAFAYIGGVNLNITLEGPADYALNFLLNSTNSEILQTGVIPPLSASPIPVFIKASGDGCALLQVNIQYNIPKFDGKEAFEIKVNMKTTQRNWNLGETKLNGKVHLLEKGISQSGESAGKEDVVGVVVCMRWLNHGSSNMAVLDFALPTGYSADLAGLKRAVSNKTNSLKRYEVEDSKIIFYFDEISSMCKTCVKFNVVQEFTVENMQPKTAKVYDYYEPGYESSTIYQFPKSKACGENDCGMDKVSASDSDGDLEDSITECKCFRECGYDGPQVCGDDGNMYPNLCRLESASCESGRTIQQQDITLCDSQEIGTITPQIVQPDDNYENPFIDLGDIFEVYPSDEAYDGENMQYQQYN